eukprot:270372-Rhodomonas_salina.1
MGAKGSKGTPSPPNLHGLFGMQNSFCPEVAGVGLVCIQTEKGERKQFHMLSASSSSAHTIFWAGLEVKSVLEGTVAHKCGLIEPGDMLKQVCATAGLRERGSEAVWVRWRLNTLDVLNCGHNGPTPRIES